MSYQFLRSRHLDALGAVALFALLVGCSGAGGLSLAPQSSAAGSATRNAATRQVDDNAKNVLYVSNLLSNVTAYPAGIHQINPRALETIANGTARPEGMWVDRNGTLYVVNGVSGREPVSVAEYKQGKTSPFRMIEDGLIPRSCGTSSADRAFVMPSASSK